jgi:hypothetical protein
MDFFAVNVRVDCSRKKSFKLTLIEQEINKDTLKEYEKL